MSGLLNLHRNSRHSMIKMLTLALKQTPAWLGAYISQKHTGPKQKDPISTADHCNTNRVRATHGSIVIERA